VLFALEARVDEPGGEQAQDRGEETQATEVPRGKQ
jgi:hypothetical protein